jgi:hypothetical protein
MVTEWMKNRLDAEFVARYDRAMRRLRGEDIPSEEELARLKEQREAEELDRWERENE